MLKIIVLKYNQIHIIKIIKKLFHKKINLIQRKVKKNRINKLLKVTWKMKEKASCI